MSMGRSVDVCMGMVIRVREQVCTYVITKFWGGLVKSHYCVFYA